MKDIKLIPVPKRRKVNSRELRAAYQLQRTIETFPHGCFSVQKDADYLVGMPIFNIAVPKRGAEILIPIGQNNLAYKTWKNSEGHNKILDRLKAEYRAIIKALIDLDIDFRVLNLQEGDQEVGSWLRDIGCGNLMFPLKRLSRWPIYPRDMFVYLKAVDTLLVHSRLFKLSKNLQTTCEVMHTTWGEGGKVLFCENRMLVGNHPEAMGKLADTEVIDRLREKGMRISAIPYALFNSLSQKSARKLSLYYESHLDLSASLLKGKDADYHLILDPGYRTGPLINPMSVEGSLDLVRIACEKIQVRVHIPRRLSVPYSTSAVQFHSGKVLATSGDEAILTTLRDIVGTENVHVTDTPIKTYPVFASAGLHCLVTENPTPLVT